MSREYEENLKSVSEALAERTSSIQSLQGEIDGLRAALNSAEGARSRVDQQLREALKSREEAHQEHERQRASLESELQATKAREFDHSLKLEQAELERAQWETLRADIEQRRVLAETERAGLEETLRAVQLVQARLADDLRAERAGRLQEQDSVRQLRTAGQELASALEQLRASHAEVVAAQQADRTRLVALTDEAAQLRTVITSLESARAAAESAQARLVQDAAALRILLENERQDSGKLRNDKEELRRQLLETGMRYRQLIQDRSESFRQTLDSGVARLRQIAESRLALLAAQHREELERLQQLVREGNLRQHDLDTLLNNQEKAERKMASESGGSAG